MIAYTNIYIKFTFVKYIYITKILHVYKSTDEIYKSSTSATIEMPKSVRVWPQLHNEVST